MSKSGIIALSLGITSIIGVCAYIAYDTNQHRDVVTLARGATIPSRSPGTVSPFGDPATTSSTSTTTELEVINGIKVPPMPETTANNATVAGIDVNANGVRDDVERLVAEEFGGNDKLYQETMTYFVNLQRGVLNPSPENARIYAKSLACFSDLKQLAKSRIEASTLNTRERVDAVTKLMHATEYYAKCSMYQ